MINLIFRIRYLLLLLTLVGCVSMWPGVKSALEVDNSLTVWFLEDDPALVAYKNFQDRFGNDEVIALVIHDKNTLLSQHYFNSFVKLTQALEKLPAVALVTGAGNIEIPHFGLFNTSSRPLLTPQASPAQVKATLAQRPLLQQQLYTPDYKTARFLIVLKPLPDFDSRRGEIIENIKNTVYRHVPRQQAYLGGVGVIYAGLNTLSQQDFGFFLGVGYLVMFLLLLCLYRRLWLLFYTLGIVLLSTYITLGIYGALGFRLNLMTTLLPVIIILLGVMDAMHIINERNVSYQPGEDNQQSALQALRRVFYPCLFTTLTTMAGFLALVTSPMAILRNFGIFSALGIFLCLVFTYLLGAIILPLTRPTPQATSNTGQQLARWLVFVLRRKKLFGGFSLLLIFTSLAGIYHIKTDTYTLGYFPADHLVVQDHERIQHNWGPYMPLELLVEPHPDYSINHPVVVQAAKAFADSVQTLSGVGQVFGFYSLYQLGLEARYYKKGALLLESKSALQEVNKQLQQDYPALARQYIHAVSGTGRITISGAMQSAQALNFKMDSVQAIARATLGQVARVTPAGYQPMYAQIVNYATRSQVNSLLLSFGLVFLLVWLFIRNLQLAALTVLPNLFPVLAMLGLMGWAGINLDTATASIAAVVLSFCIDDTIHFSYHYHRHRQAGHTPAQARLSTIRHVGPAIVFTSVVIFFGYFFMIFGSLQTVQLWGLLTAVAIAAALYSQLIIFPMLLQQFDTRINTKKGTFAKAT